MKDLSSKNYYENYDNIFRTASLSGGVEEKIKSYLDKIDNSIDKMYVYEYVPSKGKNKGVKVSNIVYKKEGLLFLKDYSRLDRNKKLVYKQEHITNHISHDWWQGIASEGDVKLKNGKKPEILLKTILSIATSPRDIVLDFNLGSGTTAAVAHKMGRRYIGVEQMDYIQDITVERLKKVLEGEQGGISKTQNWHGGGSFVYCELKEDAGTLINMIQNATEDTIENVKAAIYNDDRIVPYLTKKELADADKDFEDLTLDEKKQALAKLVDKNKLYVNASDMDDEAYQISDTDKAFTKSFYKEV